MQMNASSIVNQKAEWEKLGVKLPAFDHAAMTAATKEHPIWVHFGAGNIFRGFIAALQQRLLNEGAADRGIIAADTFDYDIIDKIYTPYDNLTMNVTLNPDGTTSREIIGYVAEGRDLNTLVSIPLAIAGWLRYLLAIDDNGNAFEVSADPLKDELQAKLSGIEFGKPETVTDQLDGILSNASIFGSDLTKTVLADKIKAYFKAEIAGAGAVRKTLHEAVNG